MTTPLRDEDYAALIPSARNVLLKDACYSPPMKGETERILAFEHGVELFCKRANFDEADTHAMFRLIGRITKEAFDWTQPHNTNIPTSNSAASATDDNDDTDPDVIRAKLDQADEDRENTANDQALAGGDHGILGNIWKGIGFGGNDYKAQEQAARNRVRMHTSGSTQKPPTASGFDFANVKQPDFAAHARDAFKAEVDRRIIEAGESPFEAASATKALLGRQGDYDYLLANDPRFNGRKIGNTNTSATPTMMSNSSVPSSMKPRNSQPALKGSVLPPGGPSTVPGSGNTNSSSVGSSGGYQPRIGVNPNYRPPVDPKWDSDAALKRMNANSQAHPDGADAAWKPAQKTPSQQSSNVPGGSAPLPAPAASAAPAKPKNPNARIYMGANTDPEYKKNFADAGGVTGKWGKVTQMPHPGF